MNVSDSRRLASSLELLGLQRTEDVENADIIVLNTCVVRQSAEEKIYGRLGSLRPLKERNPDTIIGVMGCLVDRRAIASLHKRFPWVDVFATPSDPSPLLSLVTDRGWIDEARALRAQDLARRQNLHRARLLLPAEERGRLVSAYVTAVLGCSHACTYCIIPYRRGPEKSRPVDAIVEEAEDLTKQGVREITLLGQIIDRYGYDLPTFTADAAPGRTSPLVTLLRRVHEIAGLKRIRFLTSHPSWMAPDLMEAIAELPKVCEHAEVPVQSGDDEVLQRMQRGYTSDDYRRLVEHLRESVPGVSIASDVIVGFPGESEAQFQHTVDLLEELKLDKVHIARYSVRPQTLAARRFVDDVSEQEKERRRKVLDDLQATIVGSMNAELLGSTVEVLVEGRRKGRWWGRTRTDRIVFCETSETNDKHGTKEENEGKRKHMWLGHLVPVRITWTGPWSLVGKVATQDHAPSRPRRAGDDGEPFP
jgi:tRNA-2-methylthio-N6-dimethylallyladenosine synthase